LKRRAIVHKFLLAAALSGATAAPVAAQTTRNDRADRYAAIVIEAETGKVLYERDANQRLHPASTTKMMTAYLTFKALEAGTLTLDQKLDVSRDAAGQPSTNLGMMRDVTTRRVITGKDGKKHTVSNTVKKQVVSTITVENALKGLLTHSANDAAVVLAEAIGGTENKFADMMNAEAKRLGMTHTNFENANGLPDARQLTTVEDMAKLSRALLQDYPQHYHFFGLHSFSFNGASWRNTNKMLTTYPGMDGIKTGWINSSGFNLVASAVKDGERVIGVVYGAQSPGERNEDMRQLLDYGFLKLHSPKATYSYGPSTAPAGERYLDVPRLVQAVPLPANPPANPVLATPLITPAEPPATAQILPKTDTTALPDSQPVTPPEVISTAPAELPQPSDQPQPPAGEKSAFLPQRRSIYPPVRPA
jgi:D-alanyl-D-alanine carboxypeptidase